MVLYKIRLYYFCIISIFILFSLDGFDISSFLSLFLLLLVDVKKVINEKSVIINIFYLFVFFSFLSIITNFNDLDVSLTARPLGVFCFVFFTLSNRKILKDNIQLVLTCLFTSVIVLDLIAYTYVFGYGVMRVEGFKEFYPSFRFQGFYNLSIAAIFKSFLLALLLYSRKKVKNWIFFLIVSVLSVSILLSLTRTSWLVFLIIVVSYTIYNVIRKPYYLMKVFKPLVLLFTLMICINYTVSLESFEISGVSIQEIFYKRLIVDSFEKDDYKEKERSGLYYPLKLLEKSEVRILGNGIGSSDKFGGNLFGSEENLGAHNTFVHILLDYGVLSFITFLLLIIIFVYELLMNLKYISNNVFIFSNSLAILFAFMYQDLDYYLPIVFVLVICVIFLNTRRNIID